MLLWNENLAAKYLENSLQDMINLVIYKNNKIKGEGKTRSLCDIGIQSTKDQVITSLRGKALQEQQNFLANPNYKSITEVKGKVQIQVISEISPATAYTMGEALVMALIGAWQIPRQSLLYRVISVPGNKEIYLENTPKKNIELCLVIMDSLKEEDIE